MRGSQWNIRDEELHCSGRAQLVTDPGVVLRLAGSSQLFPACVTTFSLFGTSSPLVGVNLVVMILHLGLGAESFVADLTKARLGLVPVHVSIKMVTKEESFSALMTNVLPLQGSLVLVTDVVEQILLVLEGGETGAAGQLGPARRVGVQMHFQLIPLEEAFTAEVTLVILLVIMNPGYMLFQDLLLGEGFLTNVAGGHVLLGGVLGPTKPNI